RTTGGLKESQGLGRQIVIGVLEGIAPLVGQREDLGRTPTTPMPVDPLFTGLDDALGHQRVKMTSDRRGCQPESITKMAGRRWAVLQDRPGNPVSGSGMRIHRGRGVLPVQGMLTLGFHKTIVILFGARFQTVPRGMHHARAAFPSPT